MRKPEVTTVKIFQNIARKQRADESRFIKQNKPYPRIR